MFVIKLVPNDRASRWIEQTLDAGTSILMQGSFGNFKLNPVPGKPYFFIATSAGIAPIRSQILSALKEHRDRRQLYLLFGVLKADDLFWMEEWRMLEKEYPNFHGHISCLSGKMDWHGETGPLQDRLTHILQTIPTSSIYICGSPMNVKELNEHCLALGTPKPDVHFDSYV